MHFFFHTYHKQLDHARPVYGAMPSTCSKGTLLDDFCREGFSLVKMRYEAPAFSKS